MMELKFELGRGSNHPHIPVTVNGEGPFTFTLDTGATATTISKSLAEKLGIETYEGDRKMASGVGGGMFPVSFARIESLLIGSLLIENTEIMVIDFDSLMGGARFTSGVIGHSTLKEFEMSVDYRTSTLKLKKANGSNVEEDNRVDWQKFEYIEDTHLIGVSAYLNGIGPFQLVLDTGSGGNVITPEAANKLGLSKDQSVAELRAKSPGSSGCEDGCQGVGGFAEGYAAKLDSLTAGGARIEDPTVGVIDLRVVSPRGEIIQDGIIGYPFLKELELLIDYPNKRIAFLK
ncbi:MAG: retroviral-like aspartic protease family protein, partial [Candidatus Thorarchaeota archaeon]|nr:retroviral-like aspartic protease family protein [Candidatus Thorarchaeota archaeon]